MSVHRILNITLALAFVFGLIAFMQRSDEISNAMHATASAQEARIQAIAERREWQARVSICHRAFGPQTEPAEDQDGNFFCQDARGRKVAAK